MASPAERFHNEDEAFADDGDDIMELEMMAEGSMQPNKIQWVHQDFTKYNVDDIYDEKKIFENK